MQGRLSSRIFRVVVQRFAQTAVRLGLLCVQAKRVRPVDDSLKRPHGFVELLFLEETLGIAQIPVDIRLRCSLLGGRSKRTRTINVSASPVGAECLAWDQPHSF